MLDGIKALRLERRKKLLDARAQEVAKLETDLRERLIFIIHLYAKSSHRYEELEERYGIAARKWKNVCNRVQLPGIDMICSIIKDYPQFATWLLSGKAVNDKIKIPFHDGTITTTAESQIDPFIQFDLNSTPEGIIDPTQEGWERKLGEAILWKAKNYTNPFSTD